MPSVDLYLSHMPDTDLIDRIATRLDYAAFLAGSGQAYEGRRKKARKTAREIIDMVRAHDGKGVIRIVET